VEWGLRLTSKRKSWIELDMRSGQKRMESETHRRKTRRRVDEDGS